MQTVFLLILALPKLCLPNRVCKKVDEYEPKNPNKVRSLINTFANNLVQFHDEQGESYRFLADKVLEIDQYNPAMAAKLAKAYIKYAELPEHQQQRDYHHLEPVLDVTFVGSHGQHCS